MKKTRMLSTTAAAAIVVVGFVPATSGNLAANFMLFRMDSPVVVSDGSIHGNIPFFNFHSWIEKKEQEVYTAETYDLDYLTFEGFSDENGAAPPSPLTNTGGWRIFISNGDSSRRNIKTDSITLCSTATESPQPSCMLGRPGADSWVYLETHPDLRLNRELRVRFLKKLYFHDHGTGCDDGVCDHILSIKVETMNSAGADENGRKPLLPGRVGHTYECDKVDQCKISIGR